MIKGRYVNSSPESQCKKKCLSVDVDVHARSNSRLARVAQYFTVFTHDANADLIGRALDSQRYQHVYALPKKMIFGKVATTECCRPCAFVPVFPGAKATITYSGKVKC